MKKITMFMIALTLLIMLCACGNKNTSQLRLPNSTSIEVVRITSGKQVSEKRDSDWILELIKQAELSTPTNKESIQDVPNVPEYIKIDFLLANDYEDTLFVYQEKSKWYIERPYQGIYLANDDFIETISTPQKPETLDEAIKWFLNEKEAHKFLEGQHFVFSYRVLDTIELPDSVTVYAHTLCEWISSNGDSVSGGAGLTSISFRKNNNVYEYEKSTSYDAHEIPDAPEIPQRVKDSTSTASYFDEMRVEVDKAIADIIN